MNNATNNTGNRADDDVVWTAHLARQRPVAAVLGGLAIVGFSIVVELATGERWLAGVSLGVLGVALHRFFLPTRVTLTADSIEVREPLQIRRLRWEEIRRADFGKYGVWLSPLRKSSVRESRRGAHALYDADAKARTAAIRARLPEACVVRGLAATEVDG